MSIKKNLLIFLNFFEIFWIFCSELSYIFENTPFEKKFKVTAVKLLHSVTPKILECESFYKNISKILSFVHLSKFWKKWIKNVKINWKIDMGYEKSTNSFETKKNTLLDFLLGNYVFLLVKKKFVNNLQVNQKNL